ETGEIKRYEKLKRRVPHGLMELMDISGFGPQSLKKLHKELKVKTKDEVIAALEDGRVSALKGFGQKKVDNMLRGLKLHKGVEDRMLLWDAIQVGENLISVLKDFPGIKKVELAGSLRRAKETIGDIDILAEVTQRDRKKVSENFTGSKFAQKMLAKGDTRASIILKQSGRQADLRMVDESEWGAALQYFTGSKEHNIHLRTLAKDRGYKISEYGIFNIRNNKRLAGKTENAIYQSLGMEFIPPELREDRGEIERALKGKLPELVELKDIKGDLHTHSNWSDGLHTLEEIVEFVQKKFYYDYIAVTDHSKSERVAGGMDEKGFLKQFKAIKTLNEKLGRNFLKSGVEVDILTDGSLDLSDEVLEQFDWVTASIHSGFKSNNTDRLIKACEHPRVHCIGHPTGRIVGKREPYPLDMKDVIEAARKTGTALEINAQPDRMDMNDELAYMVRESGVMIVISTDSHKLSDFYFMRLGVEIARRAWCSAENILNTRSWKDLQRIFSKKKLANA
ncbi:MAG TPA: DNA polymerase/3'-5' exonuclease PolX, partial [Cyclobacteriaceae bacterium]|nr:DNA polymerase/3'-5' exonuclease PolX [Cyclobacteriaceae bacterium]